MTGTVLIAGANGNFGRHAARAFEKAGWTVRRHSRGTDMAAAAEGADVIVNGLNPPMYHNWPVLIPRITEEVIAAARASGATVLVPGNVYVYGRQPGPWTEETPHVPASRKGRVRAAMERTYRAASADGVRVILLRAGDFIDPGNPNTLFGMAVFRGLKRGRMTTLGGMDVRRSYAYLPDMARAAVALAERRESLAAFEAVNMPGYTFSMAELKARTERLLGRPLKVGRFPWWALRLASPVWELAREMSEMRYLYETSHELGGDRFRQLLPGFEAAPLDAVIAAHLPAARPSGAGVQAAA
ncbi:MAG: NAD-dependent epimerase/dehydratase family protein [Rhodobacteraceae bacterium]|nr:NAD-dependent epimerase/dehydratase family protein [Paracoccaceae bacterium]